MVWLVAGAQGHLDAAGGRFSVGFTGVASRTRGKVAEISADRRGGVSRYLGDTARVERAVRSTLTGRLRRKVSSLDATSSKAFVVRGAEHPLAGCRWQIEGHSIDLIAAWDRLIEDVAVSIQQDPAELAGGVVCTGDGRAVGVGKAVTIVVDPIAGLGGLLTGQAQWSPRDPSLTDRSAVRDCAVVIVAEGAVVIVAVDRAIDTENLVCRVVIVPCGVVIVQAAAAARVCSTIIEIVTVHETIVVVVTAVSAIKLKAVGGVTGRTAVVIITGGIVIIIVA